MKIQEKSKFLKYSTKRYKQKRAKKTWDGIPAFLKTLEPEFSLRKDFFMSVTGHTTALLIICLLVFVFKIGVINPIMKNKDKIRDIEFTISNPSKSAPKANFDAIPLKAENPLPPKASSEPKSIEKPTKTTASASKVSKPTVSKNPIGDFSIPVPKIKPMAGGRGGISRHAGTSSSSSSSGGSSSSPFLDDDATGSGSGGAVNGKGFDKNAARKAISAYDISPYVNELKRNIRWNWKAPKDSGKTVELFLRIAKDGKVVILNVKRTSEIGSVDNAALDAVRKTMPLNPLPSKYPKSYLDVVFTFNSNSSTMGSRF